MAARGAIRRRRREGLAAAPDVAPAEDLPEPWAAATSAHPGEVESLRRKGLAPD